MVTIFSFLRVKITLKLHHLFTAEHGWSGVPPVPTCTVSARGGPCSGHRHTRLRQQGWHQIHGELPQGIALYPAPYAHTPFVPLG